MDTFWSWAGGAALVGLAWMVRTIYARRSAGAKPLLDPDNTMPALDIPRDAIYGLIEEWYKQHAAPHVDELKGGLAITTQGLRDNEAALMEHKASLEEHRQAMIALVAKIPEPKKKR